MGGANDFGRIRADATAAAFARAVNFWAPIPGVDRESSDRWQPIADRIAAKTGTQHDAFGLAVYDAVWVTAQAYLAVGGRGHAALNPAGDRRFGDFDFFDLSPSGEGYAWTLRAQYDTQRGVLTRVP